ncbi:MAG TPA: hydantoinase/oxoprolinase family protein [Gaiellaceae bacterium]|nr:hydantoinase/oxoprolinase family protein [Gaiellaceae bacterium]
MAHRLGVDVGGTFTDLLLVNDETGDLSRVKTPSTPADPSEGVLVGIRRICEESGVEPGALDYVMHGTTVATNAMLEAKGARVGLVTTQGFGQILHLARSQTPGPLAGWIIMVKPDPPAALEDTREAKERMSAQGEPVEPVDREQVAGIVRDLVESGVETLTVSLINSYANPAHEREIRDVIHELYPDFPVTISSDVLPEFREYERTLTACMNSYVRPRVETYVRNLQQSLQGLGVRGELNLLRSDAGLMSVDVASENPIYGILSGPSGGVAGALYIARRAGYDNVLTFDMGGTSTDVALCQNGQPTIERQTEIPYGLGLPGEVIPVKVPSVNVRSVGAGGGSIAHVPEVTGALRVGPQSAGADPGPASYGKGGEEPTVTDANVVVGHLPPQLLGGEMTLDAEAAKAAVQKVGDALGLDLHRAAEGILDIVNENMAGALRLVSVQRGYDPRDFALVAFGGAGPMHANAVARIMGSFPVLVPPAPGLLCATGDLVADFRDEFARTFIRTIDSVTGDELRDILEELGRDASSWLEREGIAEGDQRLAFNVDMRYYRQGYEIPVEIDPGLLAGDGTAMLADRFNEIHEQLYGFRMEETTCEIVNLRAIGYGKVPEPQLPEGEPGEGADPSDAVVDEHEVYFQGGWLPTRIYDRGKLRPGHRVPGPAIVTEFDSTTVVLSGYEAEVDRFLNLVINPTEE